MEWGPKNYLGYATMHLKNSKMLVHIVFNKEFNQECTVSCKKIAYFESFTASSFEEAKKIAEKLIVQALIKYRKKLGAVIDEIGI